MTTEDIAKRMLVLTNQFGMVARDVQLLIVQQDSAAYKEPNLQNQEEALHQDYQDLVTQVFVLGHELGLVKDEDQWLATLSSGLDRMKRREQEYKAKGWTWL